MGVLNAINGDGQRHDAACECAEQSVLGMCRDDEPKPCDSGRSVLDGVLQLSLFRHRLRIEAGHPPLTPELFRIMAGQ